MPDVHSIRLREPWIREPIDGGARLRRRFGRPDGLEPHEKVFLALTPTHGEGGVFLNGHPLAEWREGPAVLRLNVTERLNDRNELAIEMRLSGLPDAFRDAIAADLGDLLGEVRLEIQGVG